MNWHELVTKVAGVQLVDQRDMFIWPLQKKKGIFSVQSMYREIINGGSLQLINKSLWKLKLPLKVKVFLWFLHWGVILTKDNLVREHWHGNEKCCYCSNNETIQHLFFECHMARLIWRVIHTTFGLKKPNNVIHMFGT